MAWIGEVEDGIGWGDLVASKSELRAEARQKALEKDAARYRWLKSRQGLTLRTERQPNVWRRMDGTEFSATHSLAEGGTQHAPAESLDAMIDAAMLAARIRECGAGGQAFTNGHDCPVNPQPKYTQAQLDAAVAAERERCARVCEEAAYTHQNTAMLGPELNAMKCASVIRRGA